MSYDDPFFQVPRTAHDTSEGPVELPILYADTSAAYAFFDAVPDAVDAALDGTRLAAARFGRRVLVGVSCFEYRDTTVGVYNEVGVAVPVVRAGEELSWTSWSELVRTRSRPEERHLGFHVLHLPVTTAAANAAGRELWGYPKFITGIDTDLDGDELACTVHDPADATAIMRLEGHPGPSLPVPALSLLTYSILGEDLLRTTVNVRGAMRLHRGRGLRLDVGGSVHAMAETLRGLGLDGATPVVLLRTSRFQSRLNGGVAVDRVPSLVAGQVQD